MKRIMLIAHRAELIEQAVGHAKRAGLTVGMEMASQHARHEQVVVASVQSLISKRRCRDCDGVGCDFCDGGKVLRMRKFNPHHFGLLTVDEAHHAPARSYREVLKYFRQNPDLRVLMVTATPERGDKIGMWNVCDSVAYKMDLRDAIAEGWLCPIRQVFITVEHLDLSRVATKNGGDLADGDLQRAMLGGEDVAEQEMLHAIAKPAVEQAKGKPLLIFAAGKEHAEKLTAACNVYPGVHAECVTEDTETEERKRIIARYKSGETNALVGCMVFTEGFDAPATEVVAIARPTKSVSLYLQMIGRGTRPLPGIVDGPETAEERLAAIAGSAKPACIILDFVGNSGRHKLISVADVLAGEAVHESDLAAAIKAAKKSDGPVNMEALIEKAKQARENREARKAEREEKARLEASHRAERCEYTTQDVDIFGGKGFNAETDYTPKPGGASTKQVAFLVKLGVKPEEAMAYSKGRAGAVLDALTKRTGADYIVPFGKHSGKRLADIPRGYVQWAYDSHVGGQKFRDAVNAMRNPPSQPAFEEPPF